MTLKINGESRKFDRPPLTVPSLLDELGIDYPVLVEVNGRALFTRELPGHPLQDGDEIEILRMVAGG